MIEMFQTLRDKHDQRYSDKLSPWLTKDTESAAIGSDRQEDDESEETKGELKEYEDLETLQKETKIVAEVKSELQGVTILRDDKNVFYMMDPAGDRNVTKHTVLGAFGGGASWLRGTPSSPVLCPLSWRATRRSCRLC